MNKVNVTVSAILMTLPEINDAFRNGAPAFEGSILIITNEDAVMFEKVVKLRDAEDVSIGRQFPLSDYYSYGFDIKDSASDKGYLELEVQGLPEELRNYKFTFLNTPELCLVTEPLAEKVTGVKLPDVTAASSDDLLTIVDRYDEIHSAAKIELRRRIEVVGEKLGVEFSVENLS